MTALSKNFTANILLIFFATKALQNFLLLAVLDLVYHDKPILQF